MNGKNLQKPVGNVRTATYLINVKKRTKMNMKNGESVNTGVTGVLSVKRTR